MRLEQVVEDGLDRPIELRGLTEVDGHRQRPLGVSSNPHRLVIGFGFGLVLRLGFG